MSERAGVVRDPTPDEINALQTRFDQVPKGYLSNLVWNTRNRYLAHPHTTFDADEMRWLVEGFMAELRLIHGECPPAGTQ